MLTVTLTVTEFTTEYRRQPIGLDVEKPRFSWILESKQPDTVQKGYTLQVFDESGVVWKTGQVESSQSVLVEYQGRALKPKTIYKVLLSVTDNHANTALAESMFETGLMNPGNMQAKLITHGYEDKTEPCPVYIKDFDTKGEIKRARVYASALGVYEIEINGQKASDTFFAPGWTNYKTRLQYQTYDITELISDNNRIEITTANGWYSGELGFEISANH